MLAILSPARNVRPAPVPGIVPEPPLFPEETAQVVSAVREYSPWGLESLLDLPEERALELFDCYQRFDPSAPGTPALSSYYGAAFRNMDVPRFTLEDFRFAQEHLRILSALYGVLRPADGVQPYRLGIKRDFRVDGQDLYEFWGDLVYRELFSGGAPVVNLASTDYAKLVVPYLKPRDTFVTCRFLMKKPGRKPAGTVSTVRMARGRMALFLVRNRITEPEGLKEFDWAGYRFAPAASDSKTYLFIQEKSSLE